MDGRVIITILFAHRLFLASGVLRCWAALAGRSAVGDDIREYDPDVGMICC